MAKLLSFTIIALAMSMASARPAPHHGNVVQSSDNDLIDAKNLGIDINALNSINEKRGDISQYSDNDLIDLKNLGVDINALNVVDKRNAPSSKTWGNKKASDHKSDGHKKANDHKESSHKEASHHKEGSHKEAGEGNVYQYSDNDLIDAKNLNIDINALNSITKRGNVYQSTDDDLLDLKNLGVDLNLLNSVHEKRNAPAHKKKHSFKGKDGRVVQYSDNDLIDLKNLGINLNLLNSVDGSGKRSVIQKEDNDLIDAKNLKLDLNLLNSIDERSNVDAAFDVLRRANYNVDSLSLTKRGSSDMWQFDQGDHTCYCAKKSSCSTSSAKSFKPVVTSTDAPRVYAPVSTPTSSVQHHHHHHESSSSSKVHEYKPTATATTHHHHHHYEHSTSSARVEKPKPTHKASPSCPSGYKQAGEGDVIQSSDNDLVDLKNLNININILNSEGKQTSSKTVPASDKPSCTGKYCCYKTSKKDGSVTQTSDNDALDLKNTHVGLNLLNGLNL